MGSGVTIGYLNFTIFLFLFTGGLILRFDVKGYELAGMKKEKKAARILGWFNIALGAVILLGSWVYKSIM